MLQYLLFLLCLNFQHFSIQGQERNPSVYINYQDIHYNHALDKYFIGTNFTAEGSCQTLKFSYANEYEIRTRKLSTWDSDCVDNSNRLKISVTELDIIEIHNNTFFRVGAVDSSDQLCSDTKSSQTFYRLIQRGIPEWQVPSSSSVRLQIPENTCDYFLVFSWPKLGNNMDSCYCPLTTENPQHFNSCALDCKSQYSVTLLEDSVVIGNFSSSDFLVHFLCETNPCSEESCFLDSIVALHRINSKEDEKMVSVPYAAVIAISTCVISIIVTALLTSLVCFRVFKRYLNRISYNTVNN